MLFIKKKKNYLNSYISKISFILLFICEFNIFNLTISMNLNETDKSTESKNINLSQMPLELNFEILDNLVTDIIKNNQVSKLKLVKLIANKLLTLKSLNKDFQNIISSYIQKGLGPQLKSYDINLAKVLRKASCKNLTPELKFIIKINNIDLNAHGKYNNTALTCAVENNNLNNIKLLLESDADINETGQLELSPLMLAIIKNHNEIASYLIEKGANLDYKSKKTQQSALSLAVENNNYELTKLLIDKGANQNIKDSNKNTPLIQAAKNNNLPIAQLLLNKNKTSLNSKDYEGNTALMYAAKNGNLELVNLLIKKGAEINILNNSGESAKDLAQNNGFNKIAELLEELAPSTDIENEDDF